MTVPAPERPARQRRVSDEELRVSCSIAEANPSHDHLVVNRAVLDLRDALNTIADLCSEVERLREELDRWKDTAAKAATEALRAEAELARLRQPSEAMVEAALDAYASIWWRHVTFDAERAKAERERWFKVLTAALAARPAAEPAGLPPG